jgi:enterochelin esterase-like enzyme
MRLATAADAVNTYFDYMPTIAALMGRRAADQATLLQVQARLAAPTTTPPPARGLVERVVIPGTVSGFKARAAQVYLPPAYFARPQPILPVIVLLHGTPGTPEDWTRAGRVDLTLDAWAKDHNGFAPVVIMPDPNGSFTGDTECVDGRQGNAETYLTTDVPRWAMENLGVRADRTGWAIAGNSEGGYCALAIALRRPERFATFVDLSGLDRPTLRGGAGRLFPKPERDAQVRLHTPRHILRGRSTPPPIAGWFEVGGADGGTTRAIIETEALARASGMETHLVIVPGARHTWRMWRRGFSDALPWVVSRLGLTET